MGRWREVPVDDGMRLLSGRADDANPSPADVEKIDAELTRLGKVHDFRSYEGAGHAFLNFTRPGVFREAQAKDAWEACVIWLDRYLR